MKKTVSCPLCHQAYEIYANPAPTVDVIIHDPRRGVVIIERGHEPFGFALPGGFIDDGEQAEAAARREMREETGLDVELTGLLGVYSAPWRDPRRHTMSTVFAGRTARPEALRAGDDAARAAWHPLDDLPAPLCFDHGIILEHFREVLAGRRSLAPVQPDAPTRPCDGTQA